MKGKKDTFPTPNTKIIEAVAELERAARKVLCPWESQFWVRTFGPTKDILWYGASFIAQRILKKL